MPDAGVVKKILCRCMSGKRYRTRGVCTICTGTWRSGAKIGMDPTNHIHKRIRSAEKVDCIGLRGAVVIRRCSVTCVRANRMGAVPEDKHWYIGFRVVCGEMPQTLPTPAPKVALWGRDVKQEPMVESPPSPPYQGGERIVESKPPSPPYQGGEHIVENKPPSPPYQGGERIVENKPPSPLYHGGERNAPYFAEPLTFVKIPEGSNGPLFSAHNHVPAIVECPNGDMLAAWYSCVTERGRELTVVASRLRFGETAWEPAELFWGPPDRNNHATSLWRHG